MPIPATRENLVKALAESDEHQRERRADRIIWMSQVISLPAAVVGPLDAMSMINEIRSCFVDGHFIATQLLASAFVELVLTDLLKEPPHSQKVRGFQDAIELAKNLKLFPEVVLENAEHLRKLRNPFTHRKGDSDKHSFGARFMADGRHPRAILEEDARLAVEVAYGVFRVILRAGA